MDSSASPPASYIVFRGSTYLASGTLSEAASAVRKAMDAEGDGRFLVFPIQGGGAIELDLRGSVADVVRRYTEEAQASSVPGESEDPTEEIVEGARPRGRGRPRLGVVGKEVTLLPRHWAWLSSRRGGASATLRRLVEDARRASVVADRVRSAQDAAYGFMTVMAGDDAGFEEAVRALYARDADRFAAHSSSWPPDVRKHALALAAPVFDDAGEG